jgi:hypothetical protein
MSRAMAEPAIAHLSNHYGCKRYFGKEAVVAILNAGDFFGEGCMAMATLKGARALRTELQVEGQCTFLPPDSSSLPWAGFEEMFARARAR